MADNWQILPPWTSEQGPVDSLPGSPVRADFVIIKHPAESETTTVFQWAGLSRQEVANLRNLTNSEALEKLVYSYGYGISWGTTINMTSEEDPGDAEFGLMIDSKGDLPQDFVSELERFIRNYRVQ